jgi:hypothetical protein
MKEFLAGLSGFIRSFWTHAARQGFSIMLLIVTNVGLILWIDNIGIDRRRDKMEYRAEISDLRNEYRHEIARLRVVIDSLRTGLEDCNAARIRVEGQNAALLALLKHKR